MTAPAWAIALICAFFVLRLPRAWAHFPFLVGALYSDTSQTVNGMRLVILAGLVRVLIKRERIAGPFHLLDRFMIAWGCCALGSSLFHEPFFGILVLRSGLVFNCFGTYILMRIFIRSLDDFILVAKSVLVVLLPLLAVMVVEKMTAYNYFALIGSPWEYPEVRKGRVRAQGPFAHSILAGTVGAACLPFALYFWKKNRKLALMGLATTVGIVFVSASSGPILTTAATVGALVMWKFRQYLRAVRWGAILGTMGLALVMNAPVYYLISYIDLAGGSTGWHRAALMDAGVRHFNEWWFAGTDYTRHWMPTGIGANIIHTDITNVYLMMGVLGGLPLMLLFMGVLVSAFVTVGRTLRLMAQAPKDQRFVVWSLGAILFGHAVTFVSVDYFDQTVVFVYTVLAAVGSLYAGFAFQKKLPAAAVKPAGAAGSADPVFDHEQKNAQQAEAAPGRDNF